MTIRVLRCDRWFCRKGKGQGKGNEVPLTASRCEERLRVGHNVFLESVLRVP